MPQPESSRDWGRVPNETDAPWPADPAPPRWFAARMGIRPGQPPKEKPEQDGRTPRDPDGNEELEREEEDEAPASHRSSTERGEAAASARVRCDFETEDTSEWVATERFTLEDELEDTWPNVPTRFFDE
jgi:hypothetical protein